VLPLEYFFQHESIDVLNITGFSEIDVLHWKHIKTALLPLPFLKLLMIFVAERVASGNRRRIAVSDCRVVCVLCFGRLILLSTR
jgi:hypothetical protein